MPYSSTKTYGHEVGLSCCFRQWRADHSHCRFMHGYAIAVRIEFEATELDERNWVVDFGSLNPVKERLKELFDHRTIIAEDDPELEWFKEAEQRGIAQLTIMPTVGCEAFARMVFGVVDGWLEDSGMSIRCSVAQVEISEHGANSAIYRNPYLRNNK